MLSNLCRRRRWPDPHYEVLRCNGGYSCIVRVNHREYYCETVSDTEVLAREAAAQRAYQFSVNESQFSKAAGVIVAPAKAIYATGPSLMWRIFFLMCDGQPCQTLSIAKRSDDRSSQRPHMRLMIINFYIFLLSLSETNSDFDNTIFSVKQNHTVAFFYYYEEGCGRSRPRIWINGALGFGVDCMDFKSRRLEKFQSVRLSLFTTKFQTEFELWNFFARSRL